MKKKDLYKLIIGIIIFLLLTQAPVFLAMVYSGDKYQFGGFLFNPFDGNSYLAKMRQGWNGDWDFHLPFTAERGTGAYLFSFYILLGHIARWLNLDLIFFFHITRLICSAIMVWAIYWFFENSLRERFHSVSFYWVIFGGGLGGLLIPLNILAPDLWVAEGFPFLSAYANPHFPLSIALMLWMLGTTHKGDKPNWFDLLATFIAGLFLSNISPFAVIVVVCVSGIQLLWSIFEKKWENRNYFLLRITIFCFGSIPFLLYQSWVVQANPVLRIWNEQNVTPSPTIPLLIIGLSPILFWAVAALYLDRSKYLLKETWFIWVIIALILLYFPSALQRRFIIGLYVPLGIGAAKGFQILLERYKYQWLFRIFYFSSFGLSLLTNIVLIFAGINAMWRFDPKIYLTKYEADAYHWMMEKIPLESLVLAGEESGLLIPSWSGQRVIYGHPYESVAADKTREIVDEFYSSAMDINEQRGLICKYQVDYIFWSYREKEKYFGKPLILESPELTDLIYINPDASIYRVNKDNVCTDG